MNNYSQNNFYGKAPVLNLLQRRVLDLKEGYRQNVAFLGNRFVGKTVLLHQLMKEIDDEAMVVIYLDLEHQDLNYFFFRFVGSLLYNFSKIEKLPLFDDIQLLMENARPFIPQTIEEIKRIQSHLSEDKCEQMYRQLISLPEIFTAESGKFCVIILDEFQNLDELGIADVFQELGKKIMTQKRCIYIVSSSAPAFARTILSEKLSLLFGNFEILEMGAFDLKTSGQYVNDYLKEIKIKDQLRDFLVDLTAGHPLYLNLILEELLHLSALHKQSEIFIPIVMQAIENVLFHPWGVLSRHFEIMVNQLVQTKNNRAMSSVMIALANGRHQLKEIASQVGLKPAVLTQRIHRLLESGIIIKNGSVFHFQDKLLRYWIKYVFQKRMQSIDPNPDKQRKNFHEELNTAVANFQLISQKDLSSRILELLSCFDNEAFQLNGRKYKLPLFHEITPLHVDHSSGCDFQVIKASSTEGIWFIIFKKDNLSENDVNVFLRELKKLDQKPHRRVIISLSDLDENTRIRALQERIWIWNEKEINALLNFYDKPFILK